MHTKNRTERSPYPLVVKSLVAQASACRAGSPAGAWPAQALVLAALAAFVPRPAFAQTQPDLRQIVERLDRLEEQNRALLAEVHELKSELAAVRGGAPKEPQAQAQAQPTVAERLAVQESRTAELAESKVEAAHRFPIRIAGMALLNTYLNSAASGSYQYPTAVSPGGVASGGASVRQTIFGLDYSGPTIFGGGKVSGALRLDLFGGTGQTLDQELHLRTATIDIDWANTNFKAGVDKPIISPRDPESLAQVGVSPLSGAGNLWLWVPQVRLQHDFSLGEHTGLRAQAGVVQTHEVNASPASPYGPPTMTTSEYTEPGRPGAEARLEWFAGTKRRIEIATGFHHSVSHVLGTAVPSYVYSVDWFARPWHFLEFTGMVFTGQDITPLGTGAIRQGYVALGPGLARPVHSKDGWAQVTLRPAPRLWFNFFSGQEDDRNSDLAPGAIGKNLVFGANVFYRLAPNVLASLETSQTRTSYLGYSTLLNNHYDLALAYLF
jgi:hypothetical protein